MHTRNPNNRTVVFKESLMQAPWRDAGQLPNGFNVKSKEERMVYKKPTSASSMVLLAELPGGKAA
jgi:hypothetical protein